MSATSDEVVSYNSTDAVFPDLQTEQSKNSVNYKFKKVCSLRFVTFSFTNHCA